MALSGRLAANQFRGLSILSQLGFLSLVLVLAYPIAFVLRWVGEALRGRMDAEFFFGNPIEANLLVGLFAAIPASAFAMDWILRLYLKDDYRSYAATAMEAPRYPRPTGGVALGVCCALIGLSAFMVWDWSVSITKSGIVVDELFGFSKEHYPFSELEAISTAPQFVAPSGSVVDRREYVLTFEGGRRFSTRWLPVDLTAAEKAKVMAFVSRTSGAPISEVPRFQNAELE